MNNGASTMPRKMFAAVRESHRAADLERALERPREAAHDRRQDAPIKQQRGQNAHHQHDRQRLQRQHEFRAGHLELEGKLAAAEITEHERGAGLACRGNRIDRVIDRAERARDGRHLEQEDCGGKGHQQGNRRLRPGHAAAIFADDPGNAEQGEDAECGLETLHCPYVKRGLAAASRLRR
jgi:hypothetical protein